MKESNDGIIRVGVDPSQKYGDQQYYFVYVQYIIDDSGYGYNKITQDKHVPSYPRILELIV